jgi:hypothetical protein
MNWHCLDEILCLDRCSACAATAYGRASNHNSTSARLASKSSKDRNCPRYSDRGKTQDLRNSSGRRCTRTLGCKLECHGLIVWRCKLERYCRAADDSRARSRNHASDRRAAFRDRARRTQRLAAATRKLQLIRKIRVTSVQHTGSAIYMRQVDRNFVPRTLTGERHHPGGMIGAGNKPRHLADKFGVGRMVFVAN